MILDLEDLGVLGFQSERNHQIKLGVLYYLRKKTVKEFDNISEKFN